MSTLLSLENVSKQYGKDQKAISDISFSVKKGEFIAIIGPSGAGKSTLLRCINRMIDASEGNVIFDGIDLKKINKNGLRKIRTQIGMIFQHYNLVYRSTVIENVLHGRLGYKSTLAGVFGLYNQQEKEQAVHILNELGLAEHMYKRADQLSGGQKQRVGIARALIQNPKLMLCDEPIASLNPSAAKIIMDHLKEIAKNKDIAVICNLHQVDVALRYADRVIGVNKGRIIFDGVPSVMSIDKIHEIYGSDFGDLIFDKGEVHEQ
jgi:phosphonate transport system ATP-binding protein